MNLAFATCNRVMALKHLKKLYPSSDVSDESVKDLLDIIEADEIRVCDPDFHGGQIIEGNNHKPDTTERTRLALEKSGLWFSAN
jgi:hypothetical protein